MGLFSRLFKPREPQVGDESNETISRLSAWEQEHFRSDHFRRYYGRSYDRAENDCRRYHTFYRDTGERISLTGICAPQDPLTKPLGFLEKLRQLVDSIAKPTIPQIIAEHRMMLHQEIQRFRENLLKLQRLSEQIQADSFFFDLDHVFAAKLKILYNELLFCKFEELGNAAYFQSMRRKIGQLHQDMQVINTAFSEYLYALTSMRYENTRQDLERIKIQVQSMFDAAKQTAATETIAE